MPAASHLRHLLVLGATGQVGQAVVAQALHSPDCATVLAPVRRAGALEVLRPSRVADAVNASPPIAPIPPSLLSPVLPEFHPGHWPTSQWQSPAGRPWDAVICALGTTRRQAGSDAAFLAIDRDLVLAWAAAAHAHGVTRWVYVSSMGANARSGGLYLRSKGQTEDALRAQGFAELTLLRPSLLDTPPRADWRLGERLALGVARGLAPLLPQRLRAVRHDRVAAAALHAALNREPQAPLGSVTVWESDRLQAFEPRPSH